MILLKWSKYNNENYYSDKDMLPYSGDLRELITRPYKGLDSDSFNKGIFDTVSEATDGEKIWLPITYSDVVKEALVNTIENLMEDCTKGEIENLSQVKLDFLKYHSGGNPHETLSELLIRNKELFNYDITKKEYGSYLAYEFYKYSQTQMNLGLTYDTKKFAEYFIERTFIHSNGIDTKTLYFLIDMEDGLNNSCTEFALFLSHIVETSKIIPNKVEEPKEEVKNNNSFIDDVLEGEYKDDSKEEEEEETGEDEFEEFMQKAELIEENNPVNNITNIILYNSKGEAKYSLTAIYNETDDSVDTKLKRIKGEDD